MKTTAVIFILITVLMQGASASRAEETLNPARIEELVGAKGILNEKEGVFKVSVPRSDLNITVAGVKMTPPLGLTSWAAFQAVGDQTMVMGDMVMLEDQVNPVMDVVLQNGLEVTALHNHFFWDSPKVMFMHIGGMGTEEKLAAAVGKVFAQIKETSGGKGEVPHADLDPTQTSLDPKQIESVIEAKGQLNDGVYKVTIGRATKIEEHEVGNTMGINTWAAFVGSDDKAVVDGDFVMFENELQSVLKALRGAGINVVAIHNHMIGESPRTVFLHYWGVGSTRALANGLKAALDVQNKITAAEAFRGALLNFDRATENGPPAGFSIALTGGGGPVIWVIQEDSTAPSGGKVLAQTSTDETNDRFPLCVYDNLTAKDVEVSVKFKPISGKVDQAGGIVWRYTDKDNYYIVRANALEDNVVLYKVERGKRTDLKPIGAGLFAYGKKAQVPGGQWNTLRVSVRGSRFAVSLNGEHLFDVEDDTFAGAGKVGLWTKADSVTSFDDFEIEHVAAE